MLLTNDSPHLLIRRPQDHPTSPTNPSPRSPYISNRPSLLFSNSYSPSVASNLDDVLAPGDIVGDGTLLQGEPLRLVSMGQSVATRDSPDIEKPANEFKVVRRLGAGSYAVVYLVSEILYRPRSVSDEGHVGSMDMGDGDRYRPSTVFGRQYAIKCLSKANLDDEALAAQMSEVTIHQSLRSHPNIVTLHRTLESDSFLLLLLEYVPGEDLFYFLEQSRDHYGSHSDANASSTSHSSSHSSNESTPSSTSSARTPPTPSLLSSMQPSQLLSRTRLRLIASMFAQMCEAVAACHAQQVFHRDIKPENFIVTDGWSDSTSQNPEPQRKVIVKLTDFGLSTTDVDSSDMDCGSAPYMSYECRNNIAPTYRPRAADVWSLGIVLINMIYHINPWTDTAQGSCGSFELFRQHPVTFFMNRFAGMTRPVAELLTNRVFNTLDPDDTDDSKRIGAREFGIWARELPDLLGEPSSLSREPHVNGHKRVTSVSSVQGFPLCSSMPVSHRPTSRAASRDTSAVRGGHHVPGGVQPRSRASSLAYERGERVDPCELSTVIDQEVEEADEAEAEAELLDHKDYEPYADRYHDADVQVEEEYLDQEDTGGVMMTSRSTSTNKRRKRGARKGKAAAAAAAGASSPLPMSPATPLTLQTNNLPTTPHTAMPINLSSISPATPNDQTLVTLAVASQSLAREISKASKASSLRSMKSMESVSTGVSSTMSSRRKMPYEPVSLFPVPTALLSGSSGSGTATLSSGASTRSSRSLKTSTSMKSLPSEHSSKAKDTSASAPSSPHATSAPRPPYGHVPPVPQIPSMYSNTGPQPPTAATVAVAQKKPSKWKLSFGKTSAATLSPASIVTGEEPSSPHSPVDMSFTAVPALPMSATASNVTSLIMGLNAPSSHTPHAPAHNHVGASASVQSLAESLPQSVASSSSAWSRGRRGRVAPPVPGSANGISPTTPMQHNFQQQQHSRSRGRTQANGLSISPHPTVERWSQLDPNERRLDRSPNSLRRAAAQNGGTPNGSSAHLHTAASSTSTLSHTSGSSISNNWRHSTSTTSSAATSNSAFTRYSNASARSVSTAATSVSSTGSWRMGTKSNGSVHSNSPSDSPTSPTYPGVPRNIKILDGVPWELNQLPRGQHPNPDFGQPPARKQRGRKPKDLTLDTISELRPAAAIPGQKSPGLHARHDAMTSTTDLGEDGDGPKKVQKGQITALAKMLSAWKR